MEIFILMFFLHFVADFMLQSRDMGQKKSTQIGYLLGHVSIQFAVFFAGLLLILDPVKAYQIACVNAAVHGVIDWNIWKIYKWDVSRRLKKVSADEESFQFQAQHFEYWKDKGFYSTIGFDQFLHHATIIVVVWYML